MNQYYLYLDHTTWLHQLDSRTKILSFLGLCIMALTFSDPLFLLLPFAALMILFQATGCMKNLRTIWILLTLLLLYCTALWPFFVGGQTVLFSIGNHPITHEGLLFAVGMGFRIALMLLGGILLLSTTKIEDFIYALQRLGLPAQVGFALSLAFRWVPNLLGAIGATVQAQRARGLDLTATSLFDRIRRYPPLLVPLFGHQFRQTKLLAMALESKGFGPGLQPIHCNPPSMGRNDFFTLLIMGILVSLTLWMGSRGTGIISIQF